MRRNVFLDYWQQSVRGQSVIQEHEWYVPALKQAARRETTSRYLSYIHASKAPAFLPVRGRGDRDGGGGPRYVEDVTISNVDADARARGAAERRP